MSGVLQLCPSPGSLTLRSGSVLSSVTLGLRGSAPSRSGSLRGSSGVGLSSSSLELPALVKGPGRDDGGVEIRGFSPRSLPTLLRLLEGNKGNSFLYPGERSETHWEANLKRSETIDWCWSLPSQSSPGVSVCVLWRSGGGLRGRSRLQRRVTIEAGRPW